MDKAHSYETGRTAKTRGSVNRSDKWRCSDGAKWRPRERGPIRLDGAVGLEVIEVLIDLGSASHFLGTGTLGVEIYVRGLWISI